MTPHLLLISAGTGPVEARRFVCALAHALREECLSRGVTITEEVWHGPMDAPRSIGLVLSSDAESAVRDLVGTHAWVARSPERGRRARKRWFAGVTLHQLAPAKTDVDPRDVEVHRCRAGGPGGQHVNTTASAVQLHHRPTGLRVRAEGERSQHANRAAAFARLNAALAARAAEAHNTERATVWRSHHLLERGAPVRVWSQDPGS